MAVDPNSYEALTQAYNDIAAGYEDMNRQRMENYPLTRGTTTAYSTPQGISYGGGVPGTVISIGGTPQARFNPQMAAGAGYQPSSGGGGRMGGSSSAGAKGPYTPVQFNAPGKIKLPEYKPPEYDEKKEKALRSEYMGPGMAQARRAVSQAIVSSKSLDNPNARSMFIQNALSGLGQAVEKVSTGASQQARAEARARYSDELGKYFTGWKALAEETKLNWDAEWKSALTNFQEKQWGAHAGYAMPGEEGGQQYLPLQVGFKYAFNVLP